MPAEPSAPFYMVLSVYVPLVLVAYLVIFLGLSAMVALARTLVGLFRRRDRDPLPAGRARLGLAPGKA